MGVPKKRIRVSEPGSLAIVKSSSDSIMLTLDVIGMNCAVKQRKIHFEDDATHDPDEEEKDTRLKYKAKGGSLTALQSRMLQLAGQTATTDTAKMPRPDDDRS